MLWPPSIRFKFYLKHFKFVWAAPFVFAGVIAYLERSGSVTIWVMEIFLWIYLFAFVPAGVAFMKKELSFLETLLFGVLLPAFFMSVLLLLKTRFY